jgi:hypothetical protein
VVDMVNEVRRVSDGVLRHIDPERGCSGFDKFIGLIGTVISSRVLEVASDGEAFGSEDSVSKLA